MSIFNRRDIEQYTTSLAQYMPDGDLFVSKNINNSNFRKLLRGLAGELFSANGLIKQYSDEIIPDTTERFIDEWEREVGIPDGCFSGSGSIDERRIDVLVKLASLGVQTVAEFESLALIFGKTVTVRPLSDDSFPPYSVPFNPTSLPSARFIMVVEGDDLVGGIPPYSVPFDLIVGESILECLFKKLRPANCDVIFRNSN